MDPTRLCDVEPRRIEERDLPQIDHQTIQARRVQFLEQPLELWLRGHIDVATEQDPQARSLSDELDLILIRL